MWAYTQCVLHTLYHVYMEIWDVYIERVNRGNKQQRVAINKCYQVALHPVTTTSPNPMPPSKTSAVLAVKKLDCHPLKKSWIVIFKKVGSSSFPDQSLWLLPLMSFGEWALPTSGHCGHWWDCTCTLVGLWAFVGQAINDGEGGDARWGKD